jgi:hypothetical protein
VTFAVVMNYEPVQQDASLLVLVLMMQARASASSSMFVARKVTEAGTTMKMEQTVKEGGDSRQGREGHGCHVGHWLAS